jgi:hypothetical protein
LIKVGQRRGNEEHGVPATREGQKIAVGRFDGKRLFFPNEKAEGDLRRGDEDQLSVFGTNRGDGLCLYRPYSLLYTGRLDVDFLISSGDSSSASARSITSCSDAVCNRVVVGKRAALP